MIKGRRIISFILLFAMAVSMIPVEYLVSAASSATYVLDTDGIDVGEEAKNKPVETPVTEVPADPFTLYQQQTSQLFDEVRSWLEETE